MSFFSMEIMPEHNTEKRNVCVHYLSLCQNTHKIIALEFYEAPATYRMALPTISKSLSFMAKVVVKLRFPHHVLGEGKRQVARKMPRLTSFSFCIVEEGFLFSDEMLPSSP